MGWLNFGGKKRKEAQGFGDSSKTKSRKRPKSFILEKIVTPSAGVGDWNHEFDHLHQLLGSLSLSDLHLPNFFADSGVCPIDPSAPTNNLPPLIDFDPLGLYHDGIATQTPYNPGGAFETLPIALIPVDPHSPNPNNPNAIRQLLDFPLASQPLVGSIDTGVSADSPYLNYANIKQGRDYVGGDDNPLLKPGEGSEHGTFMLGIVDAINKTAPKWVGRAIDSGRWADSLVEFVDAAKASGQKNAIANLSLDLTQKNADGSVTTRYELTPAERSAIEYARQNGVMLVVAAGNDGSVMSVLGQASQEFDNIFTVGAGDINGRSNYSSFGRGLDIVADGGTTEHPGLSTVGNDLGTMAGTSVATAKVAGAASLVWAANPALNYRQVMEILKSTARDLGPSGWDDETGFGFLNTLAAVDLAKKTVAEVYNPTPWVTPDTWSGEGKVTPEERAAKGGNSIATATVQVSTNFSDTVQVSTNFSDIAQVDANQSDKYYQFTVNEPGYVTWNFTSLNPVSGFGRPNVTIIKADGRSASHSFHKGATVSMSATVEGQTSFSGGDFYDPGTYYLKVGVGSTFKDYNISTQFTADRVASFTGNIQYRTQPYKSFDDSLTAVFSGPTVSELKNLSGQVTYNNTDFNSGVANYGFEVNESGKFRINLNSPNGKMDLNINKFIGSEDRPVQIGGFSGVPANSNEWVELDLNKGRYEIEVKTPTDYWQFDGKSAQQTLVRPYTLNAIFTPNAPQPGQGKVPSSAGAFDKTVVSNGVVNHYYKNGYLTVQPSGQASWYGYPSGVVSVSAQLISEPVPLTDPDGNYSIQTAKNLLLYSGGADLGDGVNRELTATGYVASSIGGKDLSDFYKLTLNNVQLVKFELSQLSNGAKVELIQDLNGNGQVDSREVMQTEVTPNYPKSFERILGAGTYYLRVTPGPSGATTNYRLDVAKGSPDNHIIATYNSDYYLVQNGQKRLIPNQETLTAMGIDPNTVKAFPNQDLALIPSGDPYVPLNRWKASFINRNSGNVAQSYKIEDFNNPVATLDLGSQGSGNGNLSLYSAWGLDSPDNRVQKDYFAMQASTRTNMQAGKLYQVRTKSDDGTRFLLKNVKTGEVKTIEQLGGWSDGDWRGRGADEPNKIIYFKVPDSGDYDFYVQYYENDGGSTVNISMGEAKPVDGFNYVSDKTNWKSSVYWWDRTKAGDPPLDFQKAENKIGVYNLGQNDRSDGKKGISLDWRNGKLPNNDVTLPKNNFAISSYTQASFEAGKKYTASVYSDDGYQLYAINRSTGQRVDITPSNEWKKDAYGKHQAIDINVPPGDYDVYFNYFDGGGDAYFDLAWEGVQQQNNNGGSNSKLPQSASEAQAFFKNQFHRDAGLAAPPTNNCGPASLAIVLKALGLEPSGIGEQASINQAAELMGLNPTNHPDASDVDIERGIQNAGGTWINVGMGSTDQRWNTLNEALANQNPVIAFGYANPDWWSQIGYTNPGSVKHVIAILGRTSNGNYIVADPLSSRAVEVPQTTLSKFFSIYNNAPAGRAFVLPKSTDGSGTNPSQTSPSSNPQPTSGSSKSSQTALFSTDIVFQMFPNLGYVKTNIETYLPLILSELEKVGLGDRDMVLMALATIRAETEGFEPIDEGRSQYNTSPGGRPFDEYDFRSDLGNNGVGEGDRYKGRGFIQLTGKNNYQKLGPQVGLGNQLVNNPELANDPRIAAQLLARFIKNSENAKLFNI